MRNPPTGEYVGLEPTKSHTPSRVLEAREPDAPSKGSPWNPDVPQATYGL